MYLPRLFFLCSEYDGYDDVYGHSVDDMDACISPTDAQQWIYDRAKGQQSVSSFIANNRDIEEEDEDEEEADRLHSKTRRDSEVRWESARKLGLLRLIGNGFLFQNFQMPILNEEDQACLLSCMDEIRNVVGESVSERQLVETIMKFKFDCAKSLDAILNNNVTPSAHKDKSTSSTVKDSVETGDVNFSQIDSLSLEKNIARSMAEPN